MSFSVNAPRLVGAWLAAPAVATPNRPALECDNVVLTYGELDVQSTELALALLSSGIERGTRIATLSENRPEQVALFFACAKAGLVFAPLNWHLSTQELVAQLSIITPALLVVSRARWSIVEDLAATVPVARRALHLETLPTELPAPLVGVELPAVLETDGLLLIGTSGTTGSPKCALLTHANCYWTNRGLDLSVPLHESDVVLQVLPQYHVGGWNVQPLLAWSKGAAVILETSFRAERVLTLVATRGVTTMMGVPTTYLAIAQQPEFVTADLSSLRCVVVGGAPMTSAVVERWIDRGVSVVQGYGLTEASPNVMCLAAVDALDHAGSVGQPYSYVDVALYDDDSKTLVEGVGRGEICVRGPNVFAGYWNDPYATAQVLRDGWLMTGDVAERDGDGYYRISGRTKEMYISGGENVFPTEVERVLTTHHDVIDAAVVAVPHPHWGQSGVAFVVARSGSTIDVAQLRQFCRQRLAGYKVPGHFYVVAQLPLTSVGKPDKSVLGALANAPASAARPAPTS